MKEVINEHKDRSTESLNLKHKAKRENKIDQSIQDCGTVSMVYHKGQQTFT